MDNSKYLLPLSVVVAGVFVAGAVLAKVPPKVPSVAPIVLVKGVTLPVVWGDLGARMVSAGVIDRDPFETLYAERGGLSPKDRELLAGTDNGKLLITRDNSNFILNLLWAFGLGNENVILENGPMSDERYGGAEQFASTGGWTLAAGDPMDHFSRHSFVSLTPEQQELVERVARNIYRPCCDNSTYFPDCNHGMAMLGLLELMASQGVSESEMYRVALEVNAYWFPNNYETIASYLASKGTLWETIDPKILLSKEYSSASGYRAVQAQVVIPAKSGGSSCGA